MLALKMDNKAEEGRHEVFCFVSMGAAYGSLDACVPDQAYGGCDVLAFHEEDNALEGG